MAFNSINQLAAGCRAIQGAEMPRCQSDDTFGNTTLKTIVIPQKPIVTVGGKSVILTLSNGP